MYKLEKGVIISLLLSILYICSYVYYIDFMNIIYYIRIDEYNILYKN